MHLGQDRHTWFPRLLQKTGSDERGLKKTLKLGRGREPSIIHLVLSISSTSSNLPRFPSRQHKMTTTARSGSPTDEELLHIDDRRVYGYDPLAKPALIKYGAYKRLASITDPVYRLIRADIEPTRESRLTISRARHVAASIIQNHDDRILVIVGPCSIHSVEQAIEYAKLLKSHLHRWDGLQIVMRTYL
jgi:DAHP synthetase I family